MNGTALTPAQLARLGMSNEGNNPVTASQVNSFRITAVMDRLALNISSAIKDKAMESYNLCLSLSRGIDFAIGNQEIPSNAPDLPSLLKQACKQKNDPHLLAALMVLMISVKNACQSGWFSDEDSEELSSLANEIASNFCTSLDFNTEPTSSHPVISTIMSRFYPRMKMGQIIAFLEVKLGFGAYVKDFQISKHMKHSPEEKLRLFVAQTENIETSSCLVSPPQVNFLLNGNGVDRRTTVFVDTGPQMPTLVTHFLKYGSNLLQAVGQFNGNYIVIVALVTEMSTLENATVPDYVQAAAVIVDPDSEIIEGPSRISLNCPISFRRIRTPVKGHSCKHLQCFDFDNFIDINSKRPFWRCPHCNHHCCFTDIRIDQNMVKVLKEVSENVHDIIISSDGSWKAIMESDDDAERRPDQSPRMEQDEPTHPDSTSFSNAQPDLLDLTEIEDVVDAVGISEAEDRKVLSNNSQNQSSIQSMTSSPHMNNANEVHQNIAPHMEDGFWSGVYLSTFGSGTSSAILDAQIGGIPQCTRSSVLSSPVLTDAVSPVSYCEAGAFHGNTFLTNSVPQSEITSPNALQLQQFQFGNAEVSNEYGRSLYQPKNVSRTPIAVQALPAQAPTAVPPRLRNSASTLMQNGQLAASQTSAMASFRDGSTPNSNNMERPQQFSRSHANAPQVPQIISSFRQQRSNTQHRRAFHSGRPAQQISAVQAATQAQGAYQVSSGVSSELQNASIKQTSNPRMPLPVNQSAGRFQQSAQSSATLFRAQNQQGASPGVSSQAISTSRQDPRFLAGAQRSALVARAFQTSRAASFSGNADGLGMPSVGEQRGAMGSTSQSSPRSDVSVNLPAEQDWRPTGRMRGSLSGQAYSDALRELNIIRPTQQAQAVRTPLNVTSNPSNPTAQMQILMANRAALQAASYPSTGLASATSRSGASTPHPQSTGMP